MDGLKLLGLAAIAAAGYGIYKTLRPAMALAGIAGPVEGKDYETINGLGVTRTALDEIKDKEKQIKQTPGVVERRLRKYQAFITKHAQTDERIPIHKTVTGNGLSDYQRNEITKAGLRHAKEQAMKAGKVVVDGIGRPE